MFSILNQRNSQSSQSTALTASASVCQRLRAFANIVLSLLDTVFGRYQPNRVVVGAAEGDAAAAGLPLLAERATVGGRPTAYVCQHYVCQLPVTEADALARQLDAGV